MTGDATTSEEKSSRSYWGFVLWPVAIIVFYVLSEPPAEIAVEKQIVQPGFLSIYKPLEFVLDASSLWKPYGKYKHLWRPGVYDRDGGVYAQP